MADTVPQSDETRRPAWRQVFEIGDRVLDTDHPSFGIGIVLTKPVGEGFWQGQAVLFANGRRREYWPTRGKLSRAT